MARLLWSGFGLGLSPWAPGTCGTLLGVLLAWFLPGDLWLGGVALGITLLGAPLARVAERREGRTDPPSFVLDEVAGYLLTMMMVPRTPLGLALGFVAFRVADITKPPPIRKLEEIPGGWGVMADDLLAAVYANVALRLVAPLL